MTFLELYGTELDRELGSSSTTLFTPARRKAAINWAQQEWNKAVECYTRQTTIALVDETQEYDIETTVTDFAWVSKQGISIKIVDANGNERYIEGDDLEVTSVERLNTDEPGWRAVSAGTPRKVYLRSDGGARYLGFHPAPAITSGDTWTAILPYVAVVPDMSADADEPFTVSSNPIKSQRPWHRALVYHAAFDLEKLRKETGRSATALQLFQAEVEKYTGTQKPKGGSVVRLAKNYRRSMTGTRVPLDIRA